MSKKVEKKIEESKQAAEKEISNSVALHHQANSAQTQLIRLGMVAGVGRIAQTLSAQTIRGLQSIRDEKDYEALGYTRFDDFLDESEVSPMTYRQFNEREKLLQLEGDEVFDLLNNLRISNRQRKLLGSGNVELDGNKIIVKTRNEDGDEIEEEIEVDDRTRLLQTLSALADQNANLNRKTDRQKKQIEKQDVQIEELSERIQKGTVGSINSPVFDLFVRSISSLTQLKDYIKNESTLVEKEKNAELFLREIYSEFSQIRGLLGRSDLRFDPAYETGEFAKVASEMNDEELADLME